MLSEVGRRGEVRDSRVGGEGAQQYFGHVLLAQRHVEECQALIVGIHTATLEITNEQRKFLTQDRKKTIIHYSG